MTLREEQLSYVVIGKAMEVHRELGPGVDEPFYHQLLCERLGEAGLEHLYKPRRHLVHRGYSADVLEPDLVLPDRLVVELKWLWGGFAPEHYVQLKAYLKFWRISDGLLLDFGNEGLVQKRYVFDDQPAPPLDVAGLMSGLPDFVHDVELARRLCDSIARLTISHGLGYRDTACRGLLDCDLRAEHIACTHAPLATIRLASRTLGETQLPCLAIENRCAVMVLSQRADIRAADRAILQSWLRHLGLEWGMIVHFGKEEAEIRWVSATSRPG
jgi:GxxExxY protein